MRRWCVALVAVALVGAGVVGVAFAAGGGPAAPGPVATGAMPLSYSVTKVADAVGAPDATFVSVVPSCGCGRGSTEIAQFSLSTGRRLRTLARIRTSGTVSVAASDRAGDLWMTFTAGPRLGAPGIAGGGPQPGTCTSALVRYDPTDGRATTVRRFPRWVTVGNAVPSPDGQRVALLEGGCASAYFNEHIVVLGAHGARAVSIGAGATPCHSLFDAAWNAAGTELVFPFGPSTLPRHSHFIPRGTCQAPRFSRLAVVSALRPSQPGGWTLWHAQRRCSYQAAAFEGSSRDVVASEACAAGLPRGSGGDDTLGRAYLVRVAPRGRLVERWPLRFAWDGGDVVADPATGSTLVSESEGGNLGVRDYNWVWALFGSRLRIITRAGFQGASYFDAQPY